MCICQIYIFFNFIRNVDVFIADSLRQEDIAFLLVKVSLSVVFFNIGDGFSNFEPIGGQTAPNQALLDVIAQADLGASAIEYYGAFSFLCKGARIGVGRAIFDLVDKRPLSLGGIWLFDLLGCRIGIDLPGVFLREWGVDGGGSVDYRIGDYGCWPKLLLRRLGISKGYLV